MRSYYAHLETAMGAKKPIQPKPTFRSSAIFPVFQMPGVRSRILFMGYWILKRNISQIAAVITVRAESGEVIYRTQQLITEAKTYRIELDELLLAAEYPLKEHFTGSLEVEFFSTVNLVFSYPAVVINFYGPKFSSVVHTAQRVYNDFDDMRNNSQTHVAESGFNIYQEENTEPFIGIINGPEPVPNGKVKLQFYNAKKELSTHQLDLGTLAPYQTSVLYPAQLFDLETFLGNNVGTVKIHFDVNWIFPRLLVGNISHTLPAITLTHSYYDCSEARSESDYWLESVPEWHPAALMLPLKIASSYFTNLYFYPIYSPSSFRIDLEFFNKAGQKLGTKINSLQLTSPSQEFYQIRLKEICRELKIEEEELAVRVIANANGKRIPARIKLAFDMGYEDLPQMACNICTNLQPFNPALEGKPTTFKWLPILSDQPQAAIWIMNSSPAVHYERQATVQITFFRDKDATTLARTITLAPHGFDVIKPNDDQELKDFLEGQVGWCTAISTNPYTTTYYFSDNPSGVIGGDHGF